jgi:hypothetical protein
MPPIPIPRFVHDRAVRDEAGEPGRRQQEIAMKKRPREPRAGIAARVCSHVT